MTTRVLLFLLLTTAGLIAGSTTAHTQQPDPPAQTTRPYSAYPAGYSARWIEDAEFLYGPALLDFDLQAQPPPSSAPFTSRNSGRPWRPSTRRAA